MFLAVFTVSCTEKTDFTPEEYMKYIDDPKNGFSVDTKAGEIKLSVKYKPVEYNLLKNSSPESTIDDLIKKDSLSKTTVFYDLKFDYSAIADKATFYEAWKKIPQNELANEFYLVRKSDTLRPVLYHLESFYGIANYDFLLLSFEVSGTPKSAEDIELTMGKQLNYFFTGKQEAVKIGFPSVNMEKLNKLKITSGS